MKAGEIIKAAVQELQWAEAKLAAVGYPGVGEVEESVKRALKTLRQNPDAELPPMLKTEITENGAQTVTAVTETEGSIQQRLGIITAELLSKTDEELAVIAEEYKVKNWKNIKKREHLVKAIMGQAGYTVPEKTEHVEPPKPESAEIPPA